MTQLRLPIIDISPFVEEFERKRTGENGDDGTDGDFAAKKAQVAREVDSACRNYGFFYLKGHGMSAEQMIGMREIVREFFQLPDQEKRAISISEDSVRGYQKLGQNVTQQRKDWHEAIDLYSPITSDHPIHEITSSPLLKGENQYPPRPAGFKERVEAYVAKCRDIGMLTMRAIALGLGLEETSFDKLNDNSFWSFRLIGYPPLSEGTVLDSEVGVSCGEHSDYGCLTILNQDETTGALQVKAKSGEWIDANPVDEAFVVNIGDMVNVWTNNIYQATRHRVIHQKNNFRVSVPFFFEPNADTVVSPFPSCIAETGGVPHFEDVVYGLHLMSKVSNNFGKY
ncbi:hypothetical protein DFJ73DRAFT_826208 [Zopfochytrium polystomum]|nr:hypothetical protein DFJ73DRAFT_826208 [Zopfochytrium polystomum]